VEELGSSKAILGGTPVDLMDPEPALELILERAARGGDRPLAVASVNLDHLNHFGTGGRWAGTLHADPASAVDWLYLLDGAPLVAQSQRLTGRRWPRLAGSDLASPLLVRAEELGLRVGFLGGSEDNQRLLAEKIARDRPRLQVAGMWSPDRKELASAQDSERIVRSIASSGAQILYVGLGKPRQELWIDQYGSLTGASVLLAFGAAVDFLAGRVRRTPVGERARPGMELPPGLGAQAAGRKLSAGRAPRVPETADGLSHGAAGHPGIHAVGRPRTPNAWPLHGSGRLRGRCRRHRHL
jgi:exopolysaccharide biosynthesis WecB/TagA/CpsF family protein